MRFKTDRLESARNFANKLWNASRFVIMNLQDEEGEFRAMDEELSSDRLRDEDKWIISRVNEAVKYITEAMEKFDLALAGQRAYDLIWNEFCDWYIEIVKGRLYGGRRGRQENSQGRARKDAQGHAETAPSVHAVHHGGNMDVSSEGKAGSR